METVTTLLLAFGGYSAMNVAQAGQKIGLAAKDEWPVAGWLLWVGSTARTLLAVLVGLFAPEHGDPAPRWVAPHLFVLQIAYGRGKAIDVIPAFNVNFIVVPVAGGVVGFAESVHALQWLGVAVIVAGTIVLTASAETGVRTDQHA